MLLHLLISWSTEIGIGGMQLADQALHGLVLRQVMVARLKEGNEPIKGAAYKAGKAFWSDQVKHRGDSAGKLASYQMVLRMMFEAGSSMGP